MNSENQDRVQRVTLLRFKHSTSRETIADVFGLLDSIEDRVPGVLEMSAGAYSSPEGLNHGFTHISVITFANAEVRDAFLADPGYSRFLASVTPELTGGLDGLVVFDYEMNDRFRF
jgi:hypothetical protein